MLQCCGLIFKLMKHLTSTDPVSASWAGLRLALNREGIYYLISTLFAELSREPRLPPAQQPPNSHSEPNISKYPSIYILTFSVAVDTY